MKGPRPVRIEEFGLADRVVPRRDLPERQDCGGVGSGDRDHEPLRDGGVRLDAELARGGRDLLRERHVFVREALRRVGEQSHAHSGVADVDVGVVVRGLGEFGDRRDEACARCEISRAIGDAGAIGAGVPAVGTGRLAELSCADRFHGPDSATPCPRPQPRAERGTPARVLGRT